MKKLTVIILCCILLAVTAAVVITKMPPKKEAPVLLSEYWTKGSAPAESINAYIQAVTDKSSPDFIPVEDRIAVFDLDGTLMSETYPFCFEYMVLRITR